MKPGLKVVAGIEAFKGCVSLIVGFELHRATGASVQRALETIAAHLHLSPSSQLSEAVGRELDAVSASDMSMIATAALLYALVRFTEAFGLWHELEWVEWFALISGAIYIPFEVYEIAMHGGLVSVSALVINVVIVVYLYRVIRNNRLHRTE